ncbi:MAG: MFS transporter [Frankiaceae bacterium]
MASATPDGRDSRESSEQRSWWPLVAVCVAVFMLLMDIAIVNVALPAIERELGAGFDDLQWVIDAYALTLAAFLLTAGSLGDRLGRRRVFVLGIVVFALASLACGFAQSPGQLSAFRAVQGIGGAVMFANSLALIAATYHGRDRGTAFGVWGATTGASVAVGPLVGGALVSGLSWRWIFFVNLPIAAMAIYVTLRRLGESRDERARGIDWWGLVTFSGALALLVYALIRGNDVGWTSAATLAELAGSAALLLGFVIVETRSAEPMFDLGLFRKSAFVGAQVVAFCLSAAAFSLFLYLTLYLQNVEGFSAFQTGLRILPITVMALIVAPITGKLTERVPFRVLLGVSLIVTSAGLALITRVGATSSWTAALPGFIVLGAGIGATNPPLSSLAVGVVEPQRAGMASGISSTFRQVGIATGTAAFGAIFQSRVTSVLAGHLAGTPAPPGTADRLGKAVSSGAIGTASTRLPEQARAAFASAARDAFASGLDRLLWIAAAIAAAGAVLAAALIKQDQLVSSGQNVSRGTRPGRGDPEPASGRRATPSSRSMKE